MVHSTLLEPAYYATELLMLGVLLKGQILQHQAFDIDGTGQEEANYEDATVLLCLLGDFGGLPDFGFSFGLILWLEFWLQNQYTLSGLSSCDANLVYLIMLFLTDQQAG